MGLSCDCGLEFHTFEDRDVLWRLPDLQVVGVSQLHLVIAVPAQQLVHGVLRKTLQHKQSSCQTQDKGLHTGIPQNKRGPALV